MIYLILESFSHVAKNLNCLQGVMGENKQSKKDVSIIYHFLAIFFFLLSVYFKITFYIISPSHLHFQILFIFSVYKPPLLLFLEKLSNLLIYLKDLILRYHY